MVIYKTILSILLASLFNELSLGQNIFPGSSFTDICGSCP